LAEQVKKIKHLEMLVEQKDLRVVCLEEDAATASKGLGDKTSQIKNLEAQNSAAAAKIAKLEEVVKKRNLSIAQLGQ
jgi:hypothetical protein